MCPKKRTTLSVNHLHDIEDAVLKRFAATNVSFKTMKSHEI